mgnify:CR=1 FL=1
MGGVFSSPDSGKHDVAKAEAAAAAAAEEERKKERERRRRGRNSMINTSSRGILNEQHDLQRKNLLGE